MDVADCYRELGVAPGASDAEVKAAWRRLAAHWHPDRNPSPQALQKIQRINRALEGIRRAKGDETPVPIETDVAITLEEAVAGCTRTLHGEVAQPCEHCAGSGLQPQPTACGECGGSGRSPQSLWFAWAPAGACGTCQGRGTTRSGCVHCATSGSTVRKYRCRVQIPPGARPGDRIDVTADVPGPRRKQRIALRLRVALQAHEFFGTDGDGNVTVEVPVDGFAWMANRWASVPTPHGLREMRLRRGSLSYRIAGAGLPWRPEGGDCIVTVVPVFPESLSPRQEAAIDALVAGNAAGRERIGAWERRRDQWLARL